MGETQLASASNAAWAVLAAHPVTAAVIGGVLIGTSAYYLGKAAVKRAEKTEEKEAEATA